MKNLKDTLMVTEGKFQPDHHISNNNEMDKLWEQAYDMLDGGNASDCKMLQAIQQMLDTDTCVWILEQLDTDYELNLFDNED